MARFIFVTGGVVSSLGKGLLSASLGALLQARGYKVRIRKFDPYLNVDPGTMSPVPARRGLRDRRRGRDRPRPRPLRALHRRLARASRTISPPAASTATSSPRSGAAIISARPSRSSRTSPTRSRNSRSPTPTDCDFVICEIGGTVGDIESLPFIESIRQLRNDLGRDQTVSVHTTLVPWIAAAGELKTKPTQQSVRELSSLGVQPEVLLCRCDRPLPEAEREKIALFCNVPQVGGHPGARRAQHLRRAAAIS